MSDDTAREQSPATLEMSETDTGRERMAKADKLKDLHEYVGAALEKKLSGELVQDLAAADTHSLTGINAGYATNGIEESAPVASTRDGLRTALELLYSGVETARGTDVQHEHPGYDLFEAAELVLKAFASRESPSQPPASTEMVEGKPQDAAPTTCTTCNGRGHIVWRHGRSSSRMLCSCRRKPKQDAERVTLTVDSETTRTAEPQKIEGWPRVWEDIKHEFEGVDPEDDYDPFMLAAARIAELERECQDLKARLSGKG